MGNVTLPTPVVLAGGAICLLAGALVGYVLAPDGGDHTTATVASYDTSTSRLCLSGDSVKDQSGLSADGELCGTWRRSGVSHVPQPGQDFRYVVVRTTGTSGGQEQHETVIYGDVVK